MSADEARREIAANSGGQFDPDVAQTILDLIREGAFPRPHTAEQHEPRQLLSVVRPTNGRLPREARSRR
jgi:HD-GYP domain-containing protein (c-di-GMP phosphodiesterase class II)